MLSSNGETEFQRRIASIIKSKFPRRGGSQGNNIVFNDEQASAIKMIWGLSTEPRRRKKTTKKSTQRQTTLLGTTPIIPLIGNNPRNFLYPNEIIRETHQIFSSIVIIGPPGTGKTSVIVNGSLLYISEPQYRRSNPIILIGTPNNESADRILKGFVDFFHENMIENSHLYIKRIFPKQDSSYYNIDFRPYIIPRERPMNYEEEDYQNMINLGRIFIGTVHQLPKLIARYGVNPQIIMYDEGSQLTPPLMFLPLGNETSIRGICLVGDNCQLSPITTYSELSTNAIDFAIKNNLYFHQQNVPIRRQITLKIQYRMHPAIRKLSVIFALGRENIEDGPNTISQLLEGFSEYRGQFANIINNIMKPESTVIILDTSEVNAQNETQENSRINRGEFSIIKGLLSIMQNYCYTNLDYDEEETLKLLSPYRAQANLLMDIYQRAGTADIFQGQEASITFISLTLTDNIPSPHMRNNNRMHVMFSRAKRKTFIVGRRATFDDLNTQAENLRLVFDYDYIPESNEQNFNYNPVYKYRITQEFYDFITDQ